MPKVNYPHKILIVEDDQPMLDALTDNLLAAGFNQLLMARNGQDALDLTLKNSPDLILLDIVLPKMDGMTMLKKLREDPLGKKTKVILLTNLTADDSILSGIVSGEPAYYLVKAEHSIKDVIDKVKSVLQVI